MRDRSKLPVIRYGRPPFFCLENDDPSGSPNERPSPDAWTGRWHLSMKMIPQEARGMQDKFQARQLKKISCRACRASSHCYSAEMAECRRRNRPGGHPHPTGSGPAGRPESQSGPPGAGVHRTPAAAFCRTGPPESPGGRPPPVTSVPLWTVGRTAHVGDGGVTGSVLQDGPGGVDPVAGHQHMGRDGEIRRGKQLLEPMPRPWRTTPVRVWGWPRKRLARLICPSSSSRRM